MILDTSPFYAEAGGQVGDTGDLIFDGGRARVLDTTYAGPARVHTVRVEEGTLATGAGVRAVVDAARRAQVARHHSATHFLNQALREVLGSSVVQRGSFVGPDHTTFDFSFARALTRAEIDDLEARVNQHVRADLERTVDVMSLPEARASGAIALLDEKYTDERARRRLRRLVPRAVRGHARAPHRRGGRSDHRVRDAASARGCVASRWWLARPPSGAGEPTPNRSWPRRGPCARAPARSPNASPGCRSN